LYYFQVRIKHLSLKRAKTSHSSVYKTTVALCHDWKVIQYLLPCLVASLLCKPHGMDINPRGKKELGQFIDFLVKSYEESPVWFSGHRCQTSGSGHFNESMFPFTKCREKWEMVSQGFPENVLGFDLLKDCIETWLIEDAPRDPHEISLVFIWRFLCRLQFVLTNCFPSASEKMGIVEDPCQSLLTVCRIISANSYELEFSLDDDNYVNIEMASTTPSLAAQVFGFCSKHEKVDLHRLKRIKPEAMDDLQKHFALESTLLTEYQLFGIILYLCVNFKRLEEGCLSSRKNEISKPCPYDPISIAFYSSVFNDLWMLKHIVSRWLNDENCVDQSTVSHNFAIKNAPVCYAIPMQEISRKMKVKMDHPGQITFFPIKHCRWCGIVEQDVEFKVCRLCKEEPEYFDKNIFCSFDCEKEALDAQHMEDHARFYQIKCGIEF
jgi:hypothetical protein